jgi:hypothetical protein
MYQIIWLLLKVAGNKLNVFVTDNFLFIYNQNLIISFSTQINATTYIALTPILYLMSSWFLVN